MLLLIGLVCCALLLAMMGMLGFVVRCVVAIAAAAILVRFVPALSHQVWTAGQVGFSWLFFVTIFLVWLTYKVWK